MNRLLATCFLTISAILASCGSGTQTSGTTACQPDLPLISAEFLMNTGAGPIGTRFVGLGSSPEFSDALEVARANLFAQITQTILVDVYSDTQSIFEETSIDDESSQRRFLQEQIRLVSQGFIQDVTPELGGCNLEAGMREVGVEAVVSARQMDQFRDTLRRHFEAIAAEADTTFREAQRLFDLGSYVAAFELLADAAQILDQLDFAVFAVDPEQGITSRTRLAEMRSLQRDWQASFQWRLEPAEGNLRLLAANEVTLVGTNPAGEPVREAFVLTATDSAAFSLVPPATTDVSGRTTMQLNPQGSNTEAGQIEISIRAAQGAPALWQLTWSFVVLPSQVYLQIDQIIDVGSSVAEPDLMPTLTRLRETVANKKGVKLVDSRSPRDATWILMVRVECSGEPQVLRLGNSETRSVFAFTEIVLRENRPAIRSMEDIAMVAREDSKEGVILQGSMTSAEASRIAIERSLQRAQQLFADTL